MATSTDGTSWTAVNLRGSTFDPENSGYSELIFSIAYGNGKFVAGGHAGKIAYSTGNY